jgi:hypothetical protein
MYDEWKPWMKSPDSAVASAWNITERLLVALASDVRHDGVPFAIFYVPTSADVYDDVWLALRTRYGIDEKEWSPLADNARLADICRRDHIECIETIPRFRDEAERMRPSGKRLYLKHDPHWSTEGHRLAGQMLFEFMQQAPASANR